MRTALILLFILAVAAVPGSLLPQRPLNASKTQRYIVTHGAWGRLLDRLGAFDVFGSPWFAAVYLLLIISLVGCLTPRIRLHARAVRSRPLRTPRNLDRLPEHRAWLADASPDVAARELRAQLPRWRTDIREEDHGVVVIAAEKGYLRETGNLLFHVSLLLSIVLIMVGRLWSYEGQILLTEGEGFCNSVINYDNYRAGRLAQNGRVAPFCVEQLNSFTAKYQADGTAAAFNADIIYSRSVNGPSLRDNLRVNHPLRLEGDRLYLLGHGFAPKITVTMPNGEVRAGITAAFLPQDALFTSEGAFSLRSRDCITGTGTDIGLQGVFAPDGIQQVTGVVTSGSPQPLHPMLALLAYSGDLGGCNGQPHSVYSLDQTQITTGKLNRIAKGNLTVGQTLRLPGGGSVTFDGYQQWVSLQISHDPTQGYLLYAVGGMIGGLLLSLTIRRRRIWLRLTPTNSSHPLGAAGARVEIGGLGRNDAGDFHAEMERLVARLQLRQLTTPAPPTHSERRPVAGHPR